MERRLLTRSDDVPAVLCHDSAIKKVLYSGPSEDGGRSNTTTESVKFGHKKASGKGSQKRPLRSKLLLAKSGFLA